MAKVRLIELVEKQVDENGNISLLAECNEYDETGVRVQQLSRSPFTYPGTMTDQDIIDTLKVNEYKIYF